MTDPETFYVVCIDNTEFPSSLEPRKIYRRLPDPQAEQDGMIRVIDESGEDYLYAMESFVPIAVPEAAEKSFRGAA
jgi:hypothetical protein